MNCNHKFYGFGKPVIFTEEERPNQLQENSSGSLYGISITIPLIIKFYRNVALYFYNI